MNDEMEWRPFIENKGISNREEFEEFFLECVYGGVEAELILEDLDDFYILKAIDENSGVVLSYYETETWSEITAALINTNFHKYN